MLTPLALLLVFAGILVLFFFLVVVLPVRILAYAYRKIGVRPRYMFAVLQLRLLGSVINIPLFSMGSMVVAINVGGTLQHQRRAALDARGIRRLLRRLGGRQLGHPFTERPEVVVGHGLGDLAHGRVGPAAAAEQKELRDDEEEGLPADRRRIRNQRLSVRTVARQAQRGALIERCGKGDRGGRQQQERCQRRAACERATSSS